ncbi:ABC transporter permease [Geodermatophilus sp. DF01-2]|uniref:ABC transporter permease n=1 Tax=Geodermatophilus sp. DF01-2 TaxID=2559610 RepID=UPI001073ABB5|nr:ABC transporter permease [Geodermatophilus sp. DF01_2]TFV59821.1 ABC transporter permease [Geodermatophilus sp. DF01_2]
MTQTPAALRQPSTVPDPAPGRGHRRRRPRVDVDALFVPGLILVLGLALTFASPFFLTGRNLGQVLLQGAVLGIVAVGATFVIIGGDLDLSIGFNVALSGIVTALVIVESGSWPLGVVCGVLCGMLLGLVNGLLSAGLGVPAFVATLGTGTIAAGLALWLTNGVTISGLPPAFAALATTEFLGLQTLVWFMLGLFVIGGVVLHMTNFGIRVFAAGGNRDAAFLAGIAVARVRLANFVIAGACGGLAGVLLTARVQAGQPGVGTSLTLFATAAVILGGTSILGGRGSMVRTFFGVLLISVVENGLNLLGVDFSLQEVAVGVVFVLAACSEVFRRRR